MIYPCLFYLLEPSPFIKTVFARISLFSHPSALSVAIYHHFSFEYLLALFTYLFLFKVITVPITIGKYHNEITCDVLPIEDRHIMHYDKKAVHDGFTNWYTFGEEDHYGSFNSRRSVSRSVAILKIFNIYHKLGCYIS